MNAGEAAKGRIDRKRGQGWLVTRRLAALALLCVPILLLAGGCGLVDMGAKELAGLDQPSSQVGPEEVKPVQHEDLRQDLVQWLSARGVSFIARSDWDKPVYGWPSYWKDGYQFYHEFSQVIIHHSAQPNDNAGSQELWSGKVREDLRYHRARGVPDIAYNFLIDPSGRVYEGRVGFINGKGPVFGIIRVGGTVKVVAGAHTSKSSVGDQHTVGICFLGCFMDHAEWLSDPEKKKHVPEAQWTGSPTNAALQASEALVAWLFNCAGVMRSDEHLLVGYASDSSARITCHSDYAATACPGKNVRERLSEIRTAVRQLLNLAPAPCVYSMSPGNRSFSSPGGSGTVGVTCGAACPWTAQADVTWITISANGTGLGNKTVSYAVSANSGSARTGHITVQGQTHTVTQETGSCVYSMSPGNRSFSSPGGSGTVGVTCGAACPWTAQADVTWITISANGTGLGNKTVSYAVSANSGSARTGHITVQGQTHTVTQGAPAPSVAAKMYLTNMQNGTLVRANLDGTDAENLGDLNGTLSMPVGVALDFDGGKLYAVSFGSGTVSRANLDGTSGENLGNLNGAVVAPYAIVVDPTHGKLYVANYGLDFIGRANLDGTGGESLGNLNGTLSWATGIALDPGHGKIYVVNAKDGTISRANLDGTGGENLGSLNGSLNSPWHIALDIAHGKMYVTNYRGNTVSRANLDGTEGEDLGNLDGTLNGPCGIALDVAQGKMYVTNYNNNTVSRANFDGTGGESLRNLNGALNGAAGIALWATR